MTAFKIKIDQADDSVNVTLFASKKDARATGNDGHIVCSADDLNNNPLFTGPILVSIFNAVAEKKVIKFSDREAGVRRTWAALELSAAPKDSELAMAASAGAKSGAKAPKAPKKARKASGDGSAAPKAKGTRRGKVIVLVKGMENPFRVGTQSHSTYELIEEKPGKTYAEYVKLGARTNTVNGMLRDGIAKVTE